ncbi:pyrimidine-nucleoside phosphorylase [Melioribacter roseus P3M-2]|uniref:thymidine phosphorylase n=1 Tax=Melioribacter roseus (strain DSM 23840 / JCM 17771 / VKM B-2668 / P3M-2) TaxID=1191523 RepID=I6ZPU6_MELRP|nr:thymidine phosphorylase [Melioribacter roseus]AFN74074.1 pyrimidine-nucleoside phosphorylase [Melioribacter roseus P3M-2]
MNAIEIIKKKRDGGKLTSREIEFMISNFTAGIIPDYQFSAFLMAAFIRGLDKSETSYLTESMLNSGKIIDLSAIEGSKIDKHSTGGVGDKTSLILTPVVAAAGVKVPMISGRGLGHTGGTLDKLESIPGFRTDLNLSKYKSVLKKCGAVMIGQTKDIAPADKLIYALRDVTATVESIPFITASIMSKKLAEGIEGLVLDVKTGSGAFMKKQSDALELAASLGNTAKAFDKKVIAFITDMNQPLGNYIGNWLEVYESILVLKNEIKNDLYELSVTLAGAMIYLGGKSKNIVEGKKIAAELISNGKAFEKFTEITELQGGDVSFLLKPEKYPASKYRKEILSDKTGFIKTIDAYRIGMTSVMLGAGRLKKEDKIDPKAGIIFYPKIGMKIKKGDLIAEIFTDNKDVLDAASDSIKNSVEISREKTPPPKLVKKKIEF